MSPPGAVNETMIAHLRALWGIPGIYCYPLSQRVGGTGTWRLSSLPLRPSEPCALSFLPLWVGAARQARQVS